MIFKNAYILPDFSKEFGLADIEVHNGRITQIINARIPGDKVFDCQGKYLLPGLLDIHFHGCVNHDFCEASEEAISDIANYQLKNGITAICPATMTYTEEILTPVMDAAAAHKNGTGADLVGINMEGPFISENKVGAQNPKYVMRPDLEMIKRLDQHANGLVKLIDVAPEVDGCQDFIKQASKDYTISIAHTCTDYDTAKEAFKNGARHMTHLYNAMPGITHRAPGPIPAAAEDGAMAEIICDGQHIHYAAVRLAFELFGPDRMILISDSCEATGMPVGTYDLGGQKIYFDGKKAVLDHDRNTIAASATNLFECMKHAIFDAGIDMNAAVKAASCNPAKAIGVDKDYGSIDVGKYANFVLCDKEFNIDAVFQKGNKVV